jgi:hypothetical protein
MPTTINNKRRIAMRDTYTKKSFPAAFVAAAVMFVTLLDGTASAQIHPWTTVGSTGVVDEADTGIVEFVLGEARVPAAAPANSVLNLRYNIVSLEGFEGPDFYMLQVRFRDNGNAARVQLAIRQYDASSGLSSNVESFDSNDYAPAVGYQMQSECVAINWNFFEGPYYIEATLTKSGAAGQPALGTIQLLPGNCEP